VAQVIGKDASTVQRALRALSEENVLREEEHEGGKRMRFEGPFFALMGPSVPVPRGWIHHRAIDLGLA
jgi:hypothetical protein